MKRITISIPDELAERVKRAAEGERTVSSYVAAATYQLDPDLKQRLDDLTHDYRMGDAAR